MLDREQKLAGSPTFLRKAAQPVLSMRLALCRLACVTGMEVDDLAAQFFRRPARLRRLEVCRNVEFNQFRHHVLLAGNCMPLSRVLQEPPQKSQSVQAHVSLFPQSICSSSKLSATCKNPETHEELFDDRLEITEVAECMQISRKKNPVFSSTVVPYLRVKVLSKTERNF
ncbi:MAG: hypothetical protein JWM83_1038 [Candidatus Angelobacter sp.]|nr:hypothetical protein [Candidatus Angelobacter sp.]